MEGDIGVRIHGPGGGAAANPDFNFLNGDDGNLNYKRGDIRNAGAGAVWDRSVSNSFYKKSATSPAYLGTADTWSYFAAVKYEPSDKFGFSLFSLPYVRLYALFNDRTGMMKGRLSTKCSECHSTKGFDVIDKREFADLPAPAETLRRVLQRRPPGREDVLGKVLEPILMRACARYLLAEKGRRGNRALDPVAHFHLSNGARVERLNWRADTSEKGIRESFGLMVNYLYDLSKVEASHAKFRQGEVARSRAVGSPV